MLALGARLVGRGHEVTFETWERWREHVEAAGMRFVPAPEYPVFPTRERPLKPYRGGRARRPAQTRAAVRDCAPDVVVHDILTLAPALAGELEGVPVATLVPHLYPVGAPGFPPYALGARLPRTGAGPRALARGCEPLVEAGLRQGRDELNETRRRLGLPPIERLHGGLSARAVHRRHVSPARVPPRLARARPRRRSADVGAAVSTTSHPRRAMRRWCSSRPRRRRIPTTGCSAAALAGLAGEPVRVLAATNRRPLPEPVARPAPTPGSWTGSPTRGRCPAARS